MTFPAARVNVRTSRHRTRAILLATSAALTLLLCGASRALAQPATAPAPDAPSSTRLITPRGDLNIAAGLAGRVIEKVEVRGNKDVPTATVINLVRTRVGQPLDPVTVQEDYQRIYELRRFSNVEAQVQPTESGGVVVAFIVSEQRVLKAVSFRGNLAIETSTLTASITLRANESIDNFRIALAKRAIEQMYKSKNFPLASVTVDADALAKDGNLVFVINEGPNVRIRNIDFIGNKSFDEDRLKGRIQSRAWVWILRPGTLDEDVLDDDVASIREYYRSKGFFDARIGRRVIFSADQTEAQVEFLIDEGPRYIVEKVTFVGNASVPDATLRQDLKLLDGQPFDQELVERDVRRLVDHFAPLGFIYEPGSNDPDYLTITPEQRFRLKPGTIELVYKIGEGKPFELGNIEVRGNTRTKDKVILREFRKLSPGELFNATAIREATDRLRAVGLFDRVKVTPVGTEPDTRDLLVETQESKTAMLTFGAGVNSNGGISANITYTQRNFDVMNFPHSFGDIFNESAFVGAGQNFRASFEPGTEFTNASVRLTEPWLFDQPYSVSVEAFLRDRERENYRDSRLGGSLGFGHRFTEAVTGSVRLRAETVDINDITDEPARAFEILQERGDHFLTSVSASIKYDTTLPGPVPYSGTVAQATWESFGALGGDYTFQKFTGSYDHYIPLYDDLLDRKTVLALHADAGYITGDSVFFERFYGGGIGSVRGFAYRGISPRSGPDDDRIGGEFSLTGTAEISFPLAGDQLRGVVFTDVGTVEDSFRVGTIRSAVGAGVRVNLPILGQVPIAIDFAIPLSKDRDDDTQFISFSLGFVP